MIHYNDSLRDTLVVVCSDHRNQSNKCGVWTMCSIHFMLRLSQTFVPKVLAVTMTLTKTIVIRLKPPRSATFVDPRLCLHKITNT